MEKVASFTLDIFSPRIGGYNGAQIDLDFHYIEPPRATEFKALWRWWYRVALNKDGNKDYSELDKEVGNVLGSEDISSAFMIDVDWDNSITLYGTSLNIDEVLHKVKEGVNNLLSHLREELVKNSSRRDKISIQIDLNGITVRFSKHDERLISFLEGIGYNVRIRRERKMARCNISYDICDKILQGRCNDVQQYFLRVLELATKTRYKLLLRKAGNESDKYPSNDFDRYLTRILNNILLAGATMSNVRLNVYKIRDTDKEKEAIATLILALAFGGIGWGSNRGLGSIILRDYELQLNDADLIGMADALKKSDVSKVLELAGKVLNLPSVPTQCNVYNPEELSRVPSLAYMCYMVLNVNDKAEGLMKIESAVEKVTWKRIIDSNNYKRIKGGNFHTWILGLPRYAKTTGYGLKGFNFDIRRQSAIKFKILSDTKVLVYAFFSKDWYSDLKHYSLIRRRGKRSIRSNDIVKLKTIMELSQDELNNLVRHPITQKRIKLEELVSKAMVDYLCYILKHWDETK